MSVNRQGTDSSLIQRVYANSATWRTPTVTNVFRGLIRCLILSLWCLLLCQLASPGVEEEIERGSARESKGERKSLAFLWRRVVHEGISPETPKIYTCMCMNVYECDCSRKDRGRDDYYWETLKSIRNALEWHSQVEAMYMSRVWLSSSKSFAWREAKPWGLWTRNERNGRAHATSFHPLFGPPFSQSFSASASQPRCGSHRARETTKLPPAVTTWITDPAEARHDFLWSLISAPPSSLVHCTFRPTYTLRKPTTITSTTWINFQIRSRSIPKKQTLKTREITKSQECEFFLNLLIMTRILFVSRAWESLDRELQRTKHTSRDQTSHENLQKFFTNLAKLLRSKNHPRNP